MSGSLERLVGSPTSLAYLREGVKARQVSTHTHEVVPQQLYKPFNKIGHWDFKEIPAGSSWEFPMMEGPGCVTSIWITIAGRLHEVGLRRNIPAHRFVWVCIYFDGEDTPSIQAPIGHFFGNGSSKYVHFSSKFVGMTSGGYYSYLPMPFRKSCRVVMENRHRRRKIPLFYGAITYHQVPEIGPEVGYLHGQFTANTFTNSDDLRGSMIPNNPHTILEENSGPGHYVGTTITIFPTHPIKSRFKTPYFLFPYLEGNLKVFVDDEVGDPGPSMVEKPPGAPYGRQSIECTGMEDYFLSGWYYIKGPFGAMYHGCPVKSNLTGVISQYRFHEADPYPWDKRIRMTITHGEFDHVDCLMESLAFYYKSRP